MLVYNLFMCIQSENVLMYSNYVLQFSFQLTENVTQNFASSQMNIFMSFEWKQLSYLIICSCMSTSPSFTWFSVSLAQFTSLSLGLLLSSSSPRGHYVVPGRLFPPSAEEETCLAGSDKKEIKSRGLSLSLIAKGRSSAENQPDFRSLS